MSEPRLRVDWGNVREDSGQYFRIRFVDGRALSHHDLDWEINLDTSSFLRWKIEEYLRTYEAVRLAAGLEVLPVEVVVWSIDDVLIERVGVSW